jgi:MYXO-CTERM domain-containing protein
MHGNCRNGNGITHLTLFGINSSTDVPEPGSLVTLGLGLLGLGMLAGARRTADPRA